MYEPIAIVGYGVEVFGHLLTNYEIAIVLLGTAVLFALLSDFQLRELSK